MKKAISFIFVLAVCLVLCACGKADDYEAAMALMEAGNYEEAIAAFIELGDYEDSVQRLEDCKNILSYNEATTLFEAEKYEDARSIFVSLDNYKDSKEKAIECDNAIAYNMAVALISEGSYVEARDIFETISDYKDVSEYLARYVTIEITPENWGTYFTVVPQPLWEENAFGEGELVVVEHYLVISEEYVDKLITANVAMGFTSVKNCYVIEIDTVNYTYKITDNLLWNNGTNESTVTFTEKSSIPDLLIDFGGAYYDEKGEYYWIDNIDEIELVRTKGHIEIYQYSPSEVENTLPNPKETADSEPKRTGTVEIELTPENFLNFFEYAVEYAFTENAFGEVESVMGSEFLRLKEEYIPYFIKGKEIAVEITYHRAWEHGVLDYENKQFIPDGEMTPASGEPMTKVAELKEDCWDYPIAHYFGVAAPSVEANAFRVAVIDEVSRVKGTLVLSGNIEDYPQIQFVYEETTASESGEA